MNLQALDWLIDALLRTLAFLQRSLENVNKLLAKCSLCMLYINQLHADG